VPDVFSSVVGTNANPEGTRHSLFCTTKKINIQQETQLSLKNGATPLKVSQGHQTYYHSMLRYGTVY